MSSQVCLQATGRICSSEPAPYRFHFILLLLFHQFIDFQLKKRGEKHIFSRLFVVLIKNLGRISFHSGGKNMLSHGPILSGPQRCRFHGGMFWLDVVYLYFPVIRYSHLLTPTVFGWKIKQASRWNRSHTKSLQACRLFLQDARWCLRILHTSCLGVFFFCTFACTFCPIWTWPISFVHPHLSIY